MQPLFFGIAHSQDIDEKVSVQLLVTPHETYLSQNYAGHFEYFNNPKGPCWMLNDAVDCLLVSFLPTDCKPLVNYGKRAHAITPDMKAMLIVVGQLELHALL